MKNKKVLVMIIALLICIVASFDVANSMVSYQFTRGKELYIGEAVLESGSGDMLRLKLVSLKEKNTERLTLDSLQALMEDGKSLGDAAPRDFAIKNAVETDSDKSSWVPIDIHKVHNWEEGNFFQVDYTEAKPIKVQAKAVLYSHKEPRPSVTKLIATLYLNAKEVETLTKHPETYTGGIRMSLIDTAGQPFSTKEPNTWSNYREIRIQLPESTWILKIERQLDLDNFAFVATLQTRAERWVFKTNYAAGDHFGYVAKMDRDTIPWLAIPVNEERLFLSPLAKFSPDNANLSFLDDTLATKFTRSAIALDNSDIFEPAQLTWTPVLVSSLMKVGQNAVRINYVEPTVYQVQLRCVGSGLSITTTVNIWKYSTSDDRSGTFANFAEYSGQIVLEWNDMPENFIAENTPIFLKEDKPEKPWRRFVGTEKFIGKDNRFVGNVKSRTN